MTSQILIDDGFPNSSNSNQISMHYLRMHIYEGQLGSHMKTQLASVAITVVGLLFIGHVFSSTFEKLKPQWMRPFVSEKGDDASRLRTSPTKSFSLCATSLFVLALIGTGAQITDLVLVSVQDISLWMLLSAWIMIAIWTVQQRARNFLPGLFVSQCSLLIIHSIRTFQEQPSKIFLLDVYGSVLPLCVAIIVQLNMPLRDPELATDGIGSTTEQPSSYTRSPEDNISLWQFLTVSWVSPLMKKATHKRLDDEDVWRLPWDFQHTRLHQHFRELKGSVMMRLLRANGMDLVLTTTLSVIEVSANLIQPVLNQQLLVSLQESNETRTWVHPVFYACLMLVDRLVASQASVLNLWYSRRAYERSRGEMITMLYEKTLNRKIIGLNAEQVEPSLAPEANAGPSDQIDTSSPSILKQIWKRIRRTGKKNAEEPSKPTPPASTGKILNLMRNDVYEVAQRFWEFPTIFTKPFGLILSIVLVWKILGWSCLLGTGVVLVGAVINALIARQMLKLSVRRRKSTDDKLQVTTQFVEAIRHLRWYGWTTSWLNKIMDVRKVELKLQLLVNITGHAIFLIDTYVADLFPVVAFLAYTTLANQPLRLEIAFPALQVLGLLQEYMRDIPNLILVLLNAYIAMGRIEGFMKEPNKDASGNSVVSSPQPKMENASFAWPGQSNPVLSGVTFEAPKGLTLVCGKVGGGKSALLQALLGEMDHKQGECVPLNNVVGYCAQNPWLQSMSVRDNILFSSPYNDVRYRQVLDACQLTTDLAGFKAGDLSNIGENGIGLSGGQKARVALARAIYSQASVLLLDDPISALDHQTAEDLVKACFAGALMKDRTVVLVTHRVELCRPFAEQVIEVVEGKTKVHDKQRLTKLAVSGDSATDNVKTKQADEADQKAAIPDKFIEDESRAHGGVKFLVYWEYVKAGKLKWWGGLIFASIMARVCYFAQYWFLKQWSEAYDEPRQESWQNPIDGLLHRLPSPDDNPRPWIFGLFIIATVQAIWMLVTVTFVATIVYVAGRSMFKVVMKRVGHAKFRFYDITPVGRLMNRLTSDISTVDGNINFQLCIMAFLGISWIASIVVIGSVTIYFLLFAIIVTTGFALVFRRFLPGSQSLRRLEMVSLSPLMSNFGTLLDGLTTVRAFQAQSRFQERVISVVDTFQKMDHFYWSLQAWLQFRFEALAGISTLVLTILAIATDVSPGLIAYVLMSAENFIRATHGLCKQYGQLQLEFVAVERVVELMHLEEEPPGTVDPPAAWPSYGGDVVFENVTIRYAPHLEPALSNVSFRIKGGSSTAVLGRTGSGKSTLAQALLATVVPESGRVLIDGIDVNQVNKQALRSRITFVAQEPVLFPGTLRMNLDPVDEHSAEECADVLRRIGPAHEWQLDMEIDTGGKNLSQGQRQLVGLARVILRRSAVVVLDEATASIDLDTAMHVQDVLRQEMRESTVITIAHRLEAVRDADYCVVLGGGRVLEAGDAREMLEGGK